MLDNSTLLTSVVNFFYAPDLAWAKKDSLIFAIKGPELVFSKAMGPEANLPKEFRKLDKSRIHYTLIAGRRTDFKEKTYTLQRKLKKERNINFLHYDNLIETLQDLKRFHAY